MEGLGAIVKPMRAKPGPKNPIDCKWKRKVVLDDSLTWCVTKTKQRKKS